MLKHDDAKVAELERTFWAVSDPQSPRYGDFLTQAQVTERFAPPASPPA